MSEMVNLLHDWQVNRQIWWLGIEEGEEAALGTECPLLTRWTYVLWSWSSCSHRNMPLVGSSQTLPAGTIVIWTTGQPSLFATISAL